MVRVKKTILHRGPMVSTTKAIELTNSSSSNDVRHHMVNSCLKRALISGSRFYQYTWSAIGRDVYDAILDFSKYGKMLK